MRLILDTNLLFKGGPHLDGGQWPVLISAARMGLVRIYVPEVVLLEHVSHYRRNLDQAVRDKRRADKRLAALRPVDLRTPDVHDYRPAGREQQADIEPTVKSYESWLRRFIGEHGEVLPIPHTSHQDLLDTLFSGRKPFSGEKGYKDALIWGTVVEALDGDSWVFGTDNSKDFLSSDTETLASDLTDDLCARGKDPALLGVRTSLDQLVAELIPSDVAVEDQFLAFARSVDGSKRLFEMLDGHRFPLEDPDCLMPRWPEWIEAGCELDDPEFLGVEARPVDDGYLVTFQVAASSHVIGGLEHDLSPDPGNHWSVWDDWGEGLTYTYGRPQRVTYAITLRFSPPDRVSEAVVQSATLNSPWLPSDRRPGRSRRAGG